SRWSVPWIGRKSASPAAVAAGCSVACGIGMDLEKSSVHPPVFYRGADCHCAEMCKGPIGDRPAGFGNPPHAMRNSQVFEYGADWESGLALDHGNSSGAAASPAPTGFVSM